MVHVETVDLSSRNVTLPSDRVGMVFAQPFLSLTDTEPFCCRPEARAQQLALLVNTLKISRDASHGAPKTHFTVFPEYSIPGVDGIGLIDSALSSADWPNGTFVIGGVDALSKTEFASLAESQGTHFDTTHNGPERIGDNEWINCSITWVKASDGTVERWLQPKLHPAWPEQNVNYQHMFRGNSVFTFKGTFENGTSYRFFSLICFDWIAAIGGRKIWHWVLENLQRQATKAQAELSLSWCFVTQCNPKPSHDTFLSEVVNFFDQNTFPSVRRDRACLFFANSAGKAAPGRVDEYGSTSLVLPPQTLFAVPDCNPTFGNGGQRFRSSNLLAAYRDAVFRERGACIHSFVHVNPNSLIPGAAGRTIAIENAFVFPVAESTDPRTPSGVVPACIKWLNDELDQLPCLSAAYPQAALAISTSIAHAATVSALRQVSPQSAARTVKLAAQTSKAQHADHWDAVESDALVHVVHTLDIVSLGSPAPTVGSDSVHASVVLNNQTVDLVAVRGNTHEDCLKHSRGLVPMPRRQMLLVSRDPDNNPWLKRFGNFLQPETRQLGQEPKITDPSSGLLHLGYRNLLDIFQQTATATAVPGAINAELA